MSDPTFPSAAQVLHEDSARAMRLWAALIALLATAWGCWFVLARIPIHAASDGARLEAVAVHWVEAPVAGRILEAHTAVGREVRAGEVLFELDRRAEKLRESEEAVHRVSAAMRAELLRKQRTSAVSAATQAREAGLAAAAEAAARAREAEELSRLAETEARRANLLFSQGLTSEADRNAAVADAARKRSSVATLLAAKRRIEAEQRVALAERAAEADRLQSELTAVAGEVEASGVTSRILAADAERRVIRAPVGGRLASDFGKHPGSFVQEGERLTAIVPAGAVAAVGHFRPEVALGRIRPGQAARLRLDAFPPVEYGWIRGTVRSITAEPKDGRVRVEVTLHARHGSVKLEHGLTGVLEVETEAVSPLTLVLRSAGRRL